jgi:hypothetical protein
MKNIEDFIASVKEKFEILYEDDSDEKIRLNLSDYFIEIDIDKKNESFDIFHRITFDDESSKELEFENDIKGIYCLNFVDILEKQFKLRPTIEYDDCYGCPGSDELVGFFGNSLDIQIVNEFILAYKKYCNISILPNKEECDINKISQNVYPFLKQYLKKFGFCERKSFLINNERTIVISTVNVNIMNLFSHDTLILIDRVYFGNDYFLGKCCAKDCVVSTRIEHVKMMHDIQEYMGLFSEITYMSDCKKYVYLKDRFIHCVILAYVKDEFYQKNEWQIIKNKISSFKPFRLESQIIPIDFTKIDETVFEKLCFELLISKGFNNVHPVGKTNAPDGGRDIFAEEQVQSLFGLEKRLWIFQCKHSKQSINRKDVSEINELLEENQADKYGLFCSNYLTSDAIDRIRDKNNKYGDIIRYWGKNELEIELAKYPNLIYKYNLL